jgi:hypothetical protein
MIRHFHAQANTVKLIHDVLVRVVHYFHEFPDHPSIGVSQKSDRNPAMI